MHGSLYGIFPDFALLNPEYTFSLNAEHTAYAAAVTFVQASINYLGEYSPIAEKFTKAVLEGVRDSVKISLQDPRNYEARATQMWGSALSTMGILSCGKGDSWSWAIYTEMDVITECMDLSYRQALTVLFPQWLAAHAKYHGDDVRRYMVDIMGVDGLLPIEEAVAEGVAKITEFFSSLGLPMHYREMGALPDEESLMEAINDFLGAESEGIPVDDEEEETSELTAEDMAAMYMRCY